MVVFIPPPPCAAQVIGRLADWTLNLTGSAERHLQPLLAWMAVAAHRVWARGIPFVAVLGAAVMAVSGAHAALVSRWHRRCRTDVQSKPEVRR